jgi:hypothetical protein
MEPINSGTTLDIRPTPGQDIRFAATQADSVFTFGNFRIDRSVDSDFINSENAYLSYGPYSTIQNSNSNNFDIIKIINTKENELNLKSEDATSYAYFGSFYTQVANAINKIVDNFPYAFLSKSINSGITIYDYSHDLVQNFSTFKVAFSSITNQGEIIYVSGRSEQSEAQFDLYNETDSFEIQLSGNSQDLTTGDTFFNTIHKIRSYNYSLNNYLEFEVEGILLPAESTTATTFNYPLYIRPSRERYGQYKKTISSLENHLLNDGTFLVPDPDTDTFERIKFTWPRNIDGFAPDSYGSDFEEYAEDLLNAARSIDEEKTNIMVRTMLPENFIDLDSDDKIYRKLTTVYATEFDKIKNYIDGLAYAHSISYDGSESVPNKFISRLANLLGAKLPNAFTSENVLDYLSGEFDSVGKPYEEYNLELWRRIMVNLVWLYKKKGTRDAISFIFKLLGAPECLFNLEEFVYDVKRNMASEALATLPNAEIENLPSEDTGPTITFQDILGDEDSETGDGYPDVEFEIFQIGGPGRGNGQAFIDALGADYDPTKRVDNIKSHTGDTRAIVNSKEANVDLRPSRAIECDVMDWYELGYGWWNWGTTSIAFSALTVPFEWQVEDIDTVVPANMSAMTIHQWLDFIYTSNVNPRNRKTDGWQQGTTNTYRDLKKIYITYMLWTNNQESNRLTFRKLEKFLGLLERNFQEFVPFLIPATTIFNNYGTTYGNHEFNRHRFVYRPGINDGSEFQVELPPVFEPTINLVNFTTSLSNNYDPVINATNFSVNIPENPQSNIDVSNFEVILSTNISPNSNLINSNTSVYEETTNETPYIQPVSNLTPIVYPE